MADLLKEAIEEIKALCDRINDELVQIRKNESKMRALLEDEKRRSAALLQENMDMEVALDELGRGLSECGGCGHLILEGKCPFCADEKTPQQERAEGIREDREQRGYEEAKEKDHE